MAGRQGWAVAFTCGELIPTQRFITHKLAQKHIRGADDRPLISFLPHNVLQARCDFACGCASEVGRSALASSAGDSLGLANSMPLLERYARISVNTKEAANRAPTCIY